MSVTKKLVTTKLNVLNAKQFVESENELFVYVAKHTPYTGGDDLLTDPDQSTNLTSLDVYNNMIFAKRVSATNMVHMIPRYNWTANNVYDMYNHTDGELQNKPFYVVTNDGSEYNVFKCLYNANGANSTIAPSRVGSNADLTPITTGDEYVWKYMYTISSGDWSKFSTLTYVPVTQNTVVTSAAVAGQIDVIRVIDGGKGYDNYIANGLFRTGDIKVSGSDITYGAPVDASVVTDFYAGGVIKITSGAGIDQYRRVLAYNGTGAQKTFTLDSGFTILPAVGDTYSVYPYVFVFGDGNETLSAQGMAIVSANTSNSISSVEILEPGAGYRKAITYVGSSPGTVPPTANSTLIGLPSIISGSGNFIAANIEAIIPPAGGHGSDPLNELFASRVCVFTQFSNTESGMIPTQNDFRQIGIIVNPLYKNIDVFFNQNTAIGTYSVGETVSQFKNIRLAGQVTVNASANSIIKTNDGKISNTVAIANGGITYNSTVNNQILFTAPEGGGTTAAATFSNNANGTIISIIVTNQGTTYANAPVATVAPGAGGSNAVLTSALANPEVSIFGDAFSVGDYVFVQSNTQNWINTVSSVISDSSITAAANSPFSDTSSRVSKLELGATGVVTAVSVGQITVSNVSGIFTQGGKIIGLNTGATSTIRTSNNTFNAIELNDKNPNGFQTSLQLSRLYGNFEAGSSFLDDEQVLQAALIPYNQPGGYLHHAEISGGANDDVLYISNETGLFALDPTNIKPINGQTSAAILSYLSAKYSGDFVKDSGQVIYYENLDPISRAGNKSEIVKIILEF